MGIVMADPTDAVLSRGLETHAFVKEGCFEAALQTLYVGISVTVEKDLSANDSTPGLFTSVCVYRSQQHHRHKHRPKNLALETSSDYVHVTCQLGGAFCDH